jgi:hypothetical protein
MLFIKELTKNFAIAAAVTLGTFAAISIWTGGLGEKIEEATNKIINKKEES